MREASLAATFVRCSRAFSPRANGGFMQRVLPLILVAATLVPSVAHAGFGLRNSVGDSLYIVPPPKNVNTVTCSLCYNGDLRRPADIEVMPYYSFGFLTIDLALVANLEVEQTTGFTIGVRPGIRIFPFMGLYVRISVPLTSENIGFNKAYFEYQLSAGIGYQLKLGPWGFFAELNFNPSLHSAPNAPFVLPVEFRLGVALES